MYHCWWANIFGNTRAGRGAIRTPANGTRNRQWGYASPNQCVKSPITTRTTRGKNRIRSSSRQGIYFWSPRAKQPELIQYQLQAARSSGQAPSQAKGRRNVGQACSLRPIFNRPAGAQHTRPSGFEPGGLVAALLFHAG